MKKIVEEPRTLNTYEYKLFEWMAATLSNKSISASIPEAEWQSFYDKIVENRLEYILFPIVHDMAQDSFLRKTCNIWKQELIQQSVLRITNIEKVTELIQTFKDNEIPLIIIKGPAIARLYNSMQCRTMGDLDILVKNKDTGQARKIIEKMGYHYNRNEHQKEHPVHWGYKKADGLYLELHRSLLNPSFLGKRATDHWYKSIWDNCQILNYEEIHFMAMSSEDELINQILHFATHLVYGSVKIRNIYDIALLIKKFGEDIKWEYIKEILTELGIETFSQLVFSICNKYLDVEVPGQMLIASDCDIPKSKPYKDYITEDQFLEKFVFSNKATKKGWRVVSSKYPYLCKHKLGIPIVLIIEFYFELKRNKGHIIASFFNSISNTKDFRYTGQILKKLGLSI
jgi:hypothetical protein